MRDWMSDESGEVYLRVLQDELAKRGLKSDLDTRAAFARLRVFSADPRTEIPDVAEFENSVVASYFGHDLWYAWPWAEPIARVTDPGRAAGEIFDVLGPDDEVQDAGH